MKIITPRRKLLALCHQLPPQASPTANRTAELLLRLAETWEIHVIAPEGASDMEGITLHRVSAPPSGGIRNRLSRWRLAKVNDWLPLPDEMAGWRNAAFERARRVVQSVEPDTIIAFMFPYANGDIGRRLAENTNVPVVFNFDDTPTCDDMHSRFPSYLHFRRSLAWEDELIRVSTSTIYVSARNLRKVAERQSPHDRGKLHLIRYGAPSPPAERRVRLKPDGPWTLLYAGGMSGWTKFYQPKGWRRLGWRAIEALNELGRFVRSPHDEKGSSPFYVAEAMRRLEAANGTRFDFRLIGNNYPRLIIDRALQDGGMADRVNVEDAMPRDQAWQQVNEADALFLALSVRTDRSPGGLISAKTYEYLATDRPILAAIPAGENREFLEPHPGVWCVEPDDIGGMTAALGEISMAIRKGGGWASFDRGGLAKELSYDLRAQELDLILRQSIQKNRTGSTAVI